MTTALNGQAFWSNMYVGGEGEEGSLNTLMIFNLPCTFGLKFGKVVN